MLRVYGNTITFSLVQKTQKCLTNYIRIFSKTVPLALNTLSPVSFHLVEALLKHLWHEAPTVLYLILYAMSLDFTNF